MSFGFQFDDDDIDEEYRIEIAKRDEADDVDQVDPLSLSPSAGKKGPLEVARRHELEEMILSLPAKISFSRLEIPLREGRKTLFRRDLFDARFQLINDDEDHEAEEEGTKSVQQTGLEAGTNTDLIPGVYEGGFKTWECALDLVAHLDNVMEKEGGPQWLKNKQLTELGCGTALPSIYLFSQMLSSEVEGACDSTIELCDFNEQVLRLVTLPNMILTWYFARHDSDADDGEGELELTEELIQGFRDTLRQRNIAINLYSGPWQSLSEAGAFASPQAEGRLVLTSETIYSLDSLPSLVRTLEEACTGSLETALQSMPPIGEDRLQKDRRQHLCLVAAKMLYFGVGGGVNAFIEEAKRRRAKCDTVWHSQRGVARAILQVKF